MQVRAMTRPRPNRTRDRAGHTTDCARPFIVWRDVFGTDVGTCESCGRIFVGRDNHHPAGQPAQRKESA